MLRFHPPMSRAIVALLLAVITIFLTYNTFFGPHQPTTLLDMCDDTQCFANDIRQSFPHQYFASPEQTLNQLEQQVENPEYHESPNELTLEE